MLRIINKKITKSLLTTSLSSSYGELTFTNSMNEKSDYPKIPTYRAFDLDGKLLDKKVKYNP